MSTRAILGLGLVVLAVLPMAAADPTQVNISGATLFANFFTKEASTNDFVNVDNDQAWTDITSCDFADCQWVPFAGFLSCPCDFVSYVDQLAPSFDPPGTCNLPASAWWVVNYRGVGSGNGLADMRNFALTGAIPQTPPSDFGYINRIKYAELGAVVSISGCPQGPSGTPTPWAQASIDLAVMDVPTTWFVTQPGTAAWSRKPVEPGYGLNPRTSWDPGHQSNKLKSLCDPNNAANCLNLNLGAPDDRTVFDMPVAWVPVVPIANRGVIQADTACPPHQSIKESELQYLFLTGRMPTGENLIVATRDSGSGTRNAWVNSLGIDPSWGRGDNYGVMFANGKYALLGPHFRASNCGGSGEIEDVVKNARTAIGYTGLAGTSRAVGDAIAGKYEILGVTFDVRGGAQNVRPTIHAVLYNCDPNTGYQIGGNETFATVGDPFETDPGSPAYMTNQGAAGYLQNIAASIAATEAAPGGADSYFMPGELLAKDYFLQPALSCAPDPLNPTSFQANPNLNPNLRQWTEAHNGLGIGGDCPNFGQYTNLYPAPVRAKASDYTLPAFDPPGLVWPKPGDPGYNACDCSYPPDGYYSDGTAGVSYKTISGANVPTSGLAQANWLAGDFNQNGVRDINDIPALTAAIYDRYVLNPLWNGSDPNSVTPNASGQGYPWTTYKAQVPGAPNSLSLDIIGDLNGDGNFDCRDVRYFCDGLALVAGDNCGLHRWDAFVAVDQAWLALAGDNNFFNTTIYDVDGNARPWVVGASAADVAGNDWVAPGAPPVGHDCRVDCTDALYIDANFGDWANLDDAVAIDLSCDLTNDRQVGAADLQQTESLMGGVCPGLNQACIGDVNCDGLIDFADINPFVLFLSNNALWQSTFAGCNPANGDINCDGIYGQGSFGDINPFVAVMTQCGTGCPCPGPAPCP